MLEFINQEANITTTENGAATYAPTNSYCLDLFATIGALRNSYEDEIVSRFISASPTDHRGVFLFINNHVNIQYIRGMCWPAH